MLCVFASLLNIESRFMILDWKIRCVIWIMAVWLQCMWMFSNGGDFCLTRECELHVLLSPMQTELSQAHEYVTTVFIIFFIPSPIHCFWASFPLSSPCCECLKQSSHSIHCFRWPLLAPSSLIMEQPCLICSFSPRGSQCLPLLFSDIKVGTTWCNDELSSWSFPLLFHCWLKIISFFIVIFHYWLYSMTCERASSW